MRILQVISVIHPTFGGPAIGAAALSRAIQRQGHESLVVANAYRDLSGATLNENESKTLHHEIDGLVLCRPTWPAKLQNGHKLFTTIRAATKTADRVHIHGFYMLTQMFAYMACRAYGIPYGLQPHGVFEPYQAKRSRFRKMIYDAIIGDRLVKNAEYVLFASPSEMQRAVRVPMEKGVVVPLAPDFEGTEPSIEWRQRLSQLTQDGTVVLFLGRLATKKRLDVLLEAWSGCDVPGAQLLIAGPDEDFTTDGLRQMAIGLGIGNSVQLLGEVSRRQAEILFESADVFVLPSDNENFAISVVEAMSKGCCVVVTEQVAASEHVSAAGAGWVIPTNSVAAVRDALMAALDGDSGAAATRGALGRAYTEKYLGWSHVASVVLNGGRRNES